MSVSTSIDRDALVAASEGELVTSTHVQHVALPGGRTLALLTIDNGHDHTKPTVLGPIGLFGLADAVDGLRDAIVAGRIDAVAVTGKPFVFAAGADLKGAARIVTRTHALGIAQLGHDVFRRFGELGVPTFGFVNGAALGGGLELPLNCTYRTLSSGVTAIALPECFLGLVPGWGGAYLLPRLIGAERALQVILGNPLSQNRMLRAEQAYALGIADVLLEPADFLERSIAWAASVVGGETVVERVDHTVDAAGWDAAVAAARDFVDAKLAGAAPAPYRALDLVGAARTRSRDEGFAAEDDTLADLLISNEFRAGLYAFDLVQRRAKRPVADPGKALARPVTKVGLVGAGLMASQLALLIARHLDVPVVMSDLDTEKVERGLGFVAAEIDKLLAKGRISGDTGNRMKAAVTGTTDLADFADADLVIEAVFERLDVKQQVLTQLEAVVTPECVLATNTSSLSIAEMSAGLAHPERVVGIHFFNPVAVMPLVEVIRSKATDDATAATAFAFAASLRKSCVGVADAPGFVVNRLLMRFIGDITGALDTGTDPAVADQALAPLGLPMSPLVLVQLVGPAVAMHASQTMVDAFPDRFTVADNLRRIVDAGLPGVWSWDGAGKPYLSEETRAVLEFGDSPETGEELRARALNALAREIRFMLDEGVVAEPADIDLCMLLGAGWPFHLGGITPYLDREGISERATGSRFLAPGVADPVLTD